MKAMKAWLLCVLLAVILVGAGIGAWQGRQPLLAPVDVAESEKAEEADPKADEAQPTSDEYLEWDKIGERIIPHKADDEYVEWDTVVGRSTLHKADVVFVGLFLGAGPCSPYPHGVMPYSQQLSFEVKKVLKGSLKEGDLVSAELLLGGCLGYGPYDKEMVSMIVAGRWGGSAPFEEVGIRMIGEAGGQVHFVRVSELS